MDKPISFEDAVTYARGIIAWRLQEGPLFNPNSLNPNTVLAHSLQSDGYILLLKNPEQLVEEAQHDSKKYLALQYGIAKMLYLRKPLPPVALTWLVDHLQGRTWAPKMKQGRPRSITAHVWIYFLIESLVKRGLTATRNEEPGRRSQAARASACDAVALALNEVGHSVRTYKSVKEIWEKVPKLRNSEGLIEPGSIY
ncbi:hypothetical protein FHG66_11210 [Rubellimicrobium rubrum]|uniref:Uncharacterized protein n=1 Tax=Rubellimicrobium rubrum TaxID=2585369 RepID=A0A5C4MZF9_9RHOB|nr:hypothetical protein [Rubellimicrobium rubrum]TNC49302.1 hypothetical protein FHG66_11210 [Rubellimicrobium rubrum]